MKELTIANVLNFPETPFNANVYASLFGPRESSVKLVRGVKSTSSSSSDIFIVRLPFEGMPTAAIDAYVKLFAHTDRGQGILYEAMVYDYVSSRIYQTRISRNVAIVVAVNLDCSLKTVMNLVGGNANVLRNSVYLQCKLNKRPSITDDTVSLADVVQMAHKRRCYPKDARGLRYGYIMTRAMTGSNLDDYVDTCIKTCQIRAVQSCMFQIMYTVFCMNTMGVFHRDLAPYNVFVDEPTPFESTAAAVYVLDMDHVYVIEDKVLPRIFDYDRSHVREIGPNPFMQTRDRKELYGTDPENKYKDMYNILCHLAHTHGDHLRLFSTISGTGAATLGGGASTDMCGVPDDKDAARLGEMMNEPMEIVKRAGATFRVDMKKSDGFGRFAAKLRAAFKTADTAFLHTYFSPVEKDANEKKVRAVYTSIFKSARPG